MRTLDDMYAGQIVMKQYCDTYGMQWNAWPPEVFESVQRRHESLVAEVLPHLVRIEILHVPVSDFSLDGRCVLRAAALAFNRVCVVEALEQACRSTDSWAAWAAACQARDRRLRNLPASSCSHCAHDRKLACCRCACT